MVMTRMSMSGLTVTAPTLKARTSVAVVTVTEVPACLRASPTLSSTLFSSGTCCRQDMITNMSSIPMAEIIHVIENSHTKIRIIVLSQ